MKTHESTQQTLAIQQPVSTMQGGFTVEGFAVSEVLQTTRVAEAVQLRSGDSVTTLKLAEARGVDILQSPYPG